MGSIDIPPFLRDKMKAEAKSKQAGTSADTGENAIDIPDFLKKKDGGENLQSSQRPSSYPLPKQKSSFSPQLNLGENQPATPTPTPEQPSPANNFGMKSHNELAAGNTPASEGTANPSTKSMQQRQVDNEAQIEQNKISTAKVKPVTDKVLHPSLKPEEATGLPETTEVQKPDFDAASFLKGDISLPHLNSKTNTVLDYSTIDPNEIVSDKNSLTYYGKLRTDQIDNEIASLSAVKEGAGAGFNKGKIDELKAYKNKLQQSVDYFAQIHGGMDGKDATDAGIIRAKINGDATAYQYDRLRKEHGGEMKDDPTSFNFENQGLQSQQVALDAQYSGKPKDDNYYKQSADIAKQQQTIWDRHPKQLVRQWGGVIANWAADKLPPWKKLSGLWWKDVPSYITQMRKEGYDIPEAVAKNITDEDVPMSMSAAAQAWYGGASHIENMVEGVKRIGGELLDVDKDELDQHIQDSKEYLDNRYAVPGNQQLYQPQVITDTKKGSPTYMMSIPNPKAGRINPTGTAITDEVFKGLGGFAAFLLTLKAGGMAAEGVLGKALPEIAGTAEATNLAHDYSLGANVVLGSYEGNYQQAGKIIGDDPSDEGKRGLLALTNSLIDYAVFKILPTQKYASALIDGKKQLSEAVGKALKDMPADLKGLNAETIEQPLKKYLLKPIANALEETGKFNVAQTAGIIAHKIAQTVISGGNDESQKDWDTVGKEAKDLWASSAISMLPGVLGGEFLSIGRSSNLRKQGNFYAFANREQSISDIHKALDEGLINQDEANKRIQVINTGAQIINQIPEISPLTGKRFTQAEAVEWTNNRIKEVALEAQKNKITDDNVLAEHYNKRIKALQDVRQSILEGTYDPEKEVADEPKPDETVKSDANIRHDDWLRMNRGLVSPEKFDELNAALKSDDPQVKANANKEISELRKAQPQGAPEEISQPIELSIEPKGTNETDLISQAKDLVNSDVVKGFSAGTLKDAANNKPEDFKKYLSEIAQQAQDENSVNATVKTYGQPLVDIATKLFPKTEEPFQEPTPEEISKFTPEDKKAYVKAEDIDDQKTIKEIVSKYRKPAEPEPATESQPSISDLTDEDFADKYLNKADYKEWSDKEITNPKEAKDFIKNKKQEYVNLTNGSEQPILDNTNNNNAVPDGAVSPKMDRKENGITKEAQNLLEGLTSGSKPTFITKNLERIANENGVEVTNKMSADDVINALKEKQNQTNETKATTGIDKSENEKQLEEAKKLIPLLESRKDPPFSVNTTDYRGEHQLTQIKTTANDLQNGGTGFEWDHVSEDHDLTDKSTKESYRALRNIKDNPDSEVTIYRSVPKGVDKINEGDWVTLSKNYATEHGMDAKDEGKDAPVISIKVKAKDIGWDGNDLNEFVFNPSELTNNEGNNSTDKKISKIDNGEVLVNEKEDYRIERSKENEYRISSPNKSFETIKIDKKGVEDFLNSKDNDYESTATNGSPESEAITSDIESKAESPKETDLKEVVQESDKLIDNSTKEIPKRKKTAKKLAAKIEEVSSLKLNMKDQKEDFLSQLDRLAGNVFSDHGIPLKEQDKIRKSWKEGSITNPFFNNDFSYLKDKGYEIEGGNVKLVVKDDGEFSFPVNDVLGIQDLVKSKFPSTDNFNYKNGISPNISRKPKSAYYDTALDRGLERQQEYLDTAKENIAEVNRILQEAKKDNDISTQKSAEKLLDIFSDDLKEQEGIMNIAKGIDYEVEKNTKLKAIASEISVPARDILDAIKKYDLPLTKVNAEQSLFIEDMNERYGGIENAKIELQKEIEDVKAKRKEKYGFKNKEGIRQPKTNSERSELNAWNNEINDKTNKIIYIEKNIDKLLSIGGVKGADLEVSSKVEKDKKGKNVSEVIQKENLQDYGEKIGGAKKDLAQKLSEVTKEDITTQPLSRSFPEPDYAKLVTDGVIDKDGAILLKFAYDNIPTKPRKAYRIKSWVEKVQNGLDMFKGIIEGKEEFTKSINQKLYDLSGDRGIGDKFSMFAKVLNGLGFPEKNVKLGGYEIKRFDNLFKKNEEGKFINKHEPTFSILSGGSIIENYDTLNDAISGLKSVLNKSKEKVTETKFGVYFDRKKGDYFIGKKGASGVVRIVEGFKKNTDAFAHLKTKRAEVQAIWDGMKATTDERRNTNRPRVGADYRNGKNVSSEDFGKTFGFRGVEFGNWVDNKERQAHVNEAYDSLMDLANVLGVSPSSLSLNGELGFAFGARGSGKASAHYEPDKIVINLTKTRGAGSLAHEWWHSLDNYFSRNRGNKSGYITENPKQRITNEGKPDERVRKEITDAYKGVLDAINKSKLFDRSKVLDSTRSKPYWSTPVEMSARSFENYVIERLGEQGNRNDYLANFKETGEWINDTGGDIDALKNYPYPLAEESPAVNEAFKQFFDTIQTRKNDEGDDVLFDRSGTINTSAGKMPISQYVARGKEVLNKLFPEAKFEAYDNENDYENAGGVFGTRGTYDRKEKRVILNLQQIKEDNTGKTAFHEVIHPIVEAVVGDSMTPLFNELLPQLRNVPGFEKVLNHISYYAGHDAKAKEGITETLTQIADGRISLDDVPPAKRSVIYDLLNKIFKKLGLNIRLGNDYTFKDFASDIKNAFDTGDISYRLKSEVDKGAKQNDIAEGNSKKINDLFFGKDAERLSTPDLVKKLKRNGISDDLIRESLKENRGLSDAEIDKELGVEPADGGGQNPPPVEEVEGEGDIPENATHIRKEKQMEIEAVKARYEKQKIKGWSETMEKGLGKIQKEFPGSSLYDAANNKLRMVLDGKNGEGYGDLSRDETVSVFQYLKHETGRKRAVLSKNANSPDEDLRVASVISDDALKTIYEDAAIGIKEVGTEAGRTLNYLRSILYDDENGLQIRRMDMLRAKGGNRLTADEMKWTEDQWNKEKELMQKQSELREESLKEDFDKRIDDLQKEFEEKLKSAGKGKGKPQVKVEERERTLKQSGQKLADKILKAKIKTDPNKLQANLLGLPVAAYNTLIDGIAEAVKGTANLAQAIKDVIDSKKYPGLTEEALTDHLVSLVNRTTPEEALQKIKEYAEKNEVNDIDREMVSKGLIKDFVESHIGEMDHKDILREAAKSLEDVLPDVDEEKLRKAFLKKDEFAPEKKEDLLKQVKEQQQALKHIATLEDDIASLNDLKESRKKMPANEREKSDYEKQLMAEKAALIKDLHGKQKRSDKLKELDANIKRAKAGQDVIKTHRDTSDREIDDLMEQKQYELKKAIGDNMSEEKVQEKLLEQAKKQKLSKIKQLKRRIENGEYEDADKKLLNKSDAELVKIDRDLNNVESEFRTRQRDLRKQNRSGLELMTDLGRSAYMAFLLHRFLTLTKVAASAIIRPNIETATRLVPGKVFDKFFPGIGSAALMGGETSYWKDNMQGMGAWFRQRGAMSLERAAIKTENEYQKSDKRYTDYKNSIKPDEKTLERLRKDKDNKMVATFGMLGYNFIGGSSAKDFLQAFVHRSNEIERQFGKVGGEGARGEKAIGQQDSGPMILKKIGQQVIEGGVDLFTGYDNKSSKFKQAAIKTVSDADYILGFIGRSHSAFKTLSGRYSFMASFMARVRGAVQRDIELTPDKVLEFAHESYLDWERGKYQNPNQISDWWSSVVNNLDRNPKYKQVGKIGKLAFQTEVAIQRVPVNILWEEVSQYAFGLVKNAGLVPFSKNRLASIPKAYREAKEQLADEGTFVHDPEFKQALKDKMSELDPYQAALIKACFRKGLVGLGVYATALILGGIHYGIFPHLGQKKKKPDEELAPDELNPGQIMIGNTKWNEEFSALISHTQFLWPTFMGLGMAQAYKDQINKGKTSPEAAANAAYLHLNITLGGIPQFAPVDYVKTRTIDPAVNKGIKKAFGAEHQGYSSEDEKDTTFKHYFDKGIKFTPFDPSKINIPMNAENGTPISKKLSELPKVKWQDYQKEYKNVLKNQLNALKSNAYFTDSTGNVYVDDQPQDFPTQVKTLDSLTQKQLQEVIKPAERAATTAAKEKLRVGAFSILNINNENNHRDSTKR